MFDLVGDIHGHADALQRSGHSGEVTARNLAASELLRSLRGVLRGDDLLALVVPAARADAVRHGRGAAVGALAEAGSFEKIVSPPHVATALGVAAFWIGHCL